MNNIIVTVNKKDRTVISPKTYIGVTGENLQEKLIFEFEDEFVDGVARLETQIGEDKNFINMNKEGETYTLPVKNVLTVNGTIELQLVITLSEEDEETPLFKSEVFKLYCKRSINAVEEAPDGYELWIDTANKLLGELDKIKVNATEVDKTLYVSITDRNGKTTNAEIREGKDGTNGLDGVIQYTAGTGINISPSNVISAIGEKYYAGQNIQITDTNVINAIIDLTNYYNKTQVDEMIGSLQSITLEIVQTLPTTGNAGTIYLVPVYIPETDPPELDYYTQHIYTNSAWQQIGTTKVDLTNYYTKTEVDGLLENKQDKLEEVSEPISPITDTTIFSSVDLTTNQVSKIPASVLKNYIGRVSTNLQWETLPPITVDNLGSIVQYIGEDTSTRKKGFWYQAVREFSWYAWVNPITSTNVYTANREPGIGDNLHKLEGGVIVETDLVVSRVDEYNIYDNNNTRYTRNSSSDRDMTYKWNILNDNLSRYLNDAGYLKEENITGAISTGISSDFTGNRVIISTPMGKLSWSDITHEELNKLSGVTSNIQSQLDLKQHALFESPELVNFTDTVPLSSVSIDGNTVTPVKGLTIWNYIKGKMTGAISPVITSTLTSGKVVTTNASGRLTNSPVNVTELGYLEGLTKSLALTEAVDGNAFVYYSSRSQGYKVTGDYETNVKRRAWKQGNICNLSFHCTGNTDGAYGANWTTIGQVPSGFRPKYKTPIVAMIYDGNNGNQSAGGYIQTDGWLVIWTNAKTNTNNYQVRVNVSYLIS